MYSNGVLEEEGKEKCYIQHISKVKRNNPCFYTYVSNFSGNSFFGIKSGSKRTGEFMLYNMTHKNHQ